jgi:tetratricopeptide (TPR) repeat protein
MASLIPGYNYDIFVSYRQKDNKGDRWVSEFVNALKDELESTFKEEISVYFDINPHDGLLETHDVDASLKEKLKCLVFIPIISRTYCDPKSFAWEYEFIAFIDQASQDQYGLKVKLLNGNVASRVLPIRIHDLDNGDIKLCESVIGGILRCIEFIYREPGVNRPLRSTEDSPGDNLNKTFYRNQVNKVALAVKEIILGLQQESVISAKESIQHREPLEEVGKEERKKEKGKSTRMPMRKLLSGITILVVLIFVIILVYPKIIKRYTVEKLRASGERISVAVMPFHNMTNDTTWNIYQEGIQDNISAYLSNFSDALKVRQVESINRIIQNNGFLSYTSITQAVAGNISEKLNAEIFVYGGIIKAGSTIRVNAQLFDTKTKESFKSFHVEGTSEENIITLIDSLSAQVKNFLLITRLKKGPNIYSQYYETSASSPEAFRYVVLGNTAFYKADYPTARKMYSQAVAIDSCLYMAALKLVIAYWNPGLYKEAKKLCLKIYGKKERMTDFQKIYAEVVYALVFLTPNETIKCVNQLLEIDDELPATYYMLGFLYDNLQLYDKAIPPLEKSLEIFDKWNVKPMWFANYYYLGNAYHKTGQYRKEKKLYKKADLDFPNNFDMITLKAILALSERDTVAANGYIEKLGTLLKEYSASEVLIMDFLANVYSEAGILDKAEKYFRKALSLEPENPDRLNNLAYFLYKNNIKISEGLNLIDKALQLKPDNYIFKATKGELLYKYGKYTEALKLLEESWKLKPVYNHDIYLSLQETKKAVARQKNN